MRSVEDVRRRVLDASIALVADHGVRAVSFREVARRAGVSHQAPYHHFGNHHGILRAIADEGFTRLTAAMTAAAAGERDPNRALRAAGIAYVTFALAHVGHFRVMFQRPPTDDGGGPVPAAAETHATLLRLGADAHRAGAGRGLPALALSHLAWSTVHGVATLLLEGLMRDTAGGVDDAAIAGQVVSALSGLLAPAGAAATAPG